MTFICGFCKKPFEIPKGGCDWRTQMSRPVCKECSEKGW